MMLANFIFMNHSEVGPINVIGFVAFILCGFVVAPLLFYKKDAQFKHKWMPRYAILIGLLFILMLYGIPWQVIAFFIAPSIALITFLNIRNTKFCDACGKTLYNHMWFSK